MKTLDKIRAATKATVVAIATLLHTAAFGQVVTVFFDDLESTPFVECSGANPTRAWSTFDATVEHDPTSPFPNFGATVVALGPSGLLETCDLDTTVAGANGVSLVSFWVRSDQLAPDDSLLVEYATSDGSFRELGTVRAADALSAIYTYIEFQLPPDAYHPRARMRFVPSITSPDAAWRLENPFLGAAPATYPPFFDDFEDGIDDFLDWVDQEADLITLASAPSGEHAASLGPGGRLQSRTLALSSYPSGPGYSIDWHVRAWVRPVDVPAGGRLRIEYLDGDLDDDGVCDDPVIKVPAVPASNGSSPACSRLVEFPVPRGDLTDGFYLRFVNESTEGFWAIDDVSISTDAIEDDPRCHAINLAASCGVLDLSDIDRFISAFINADPAADVTTPSGVPDVADINFFVSAFAAGCRVTYGEP